MSKEKLIAEQVAEEFLKWQYSQPNIRLLEQSSLRENLSGRIILMMLKIEKDHRIEKIKRTITVLFILGILFALANL